jgi:two-component system phosphate regulon response regulator OmpR
VSDTQKILIIEDDRETLALLTTYLEREGFACDVASSGKVGLERAQKGEPSLVILDVMLPEMNGLDVLKALRRTSDVPVLVLTARGEDVDRIIGLELGADDYLPKPFNPRELVARMKSILRRTQPPRKDHETLRVGALVLDLSAYEARLDDVLLVLTSIEFAILRELMQSAGRVLSRELLLERVRNREFDVFDRSIDVHVSHLRQKLNDDPKTPRWIKTVRGVGYLFMKDEPAS